LRTWDLDNARLARLVDENDQTQIQKAALFKVDHPRAYQKSRVRGGQTMISTQLPAHMKPELVGDARTELWKFAAGVHKDGSVKSPAAHSQARAAILREAKINEVQAKDECEWTEEDHALMKDEVSRKLRVAEKNRARQKKMMKEQLDVANAFIEKHPTLLVSNENPLSEQEAFDVAFNLIDDKDSEYGKFLFETLGQKTLRDVFWDGTPGFAMYILSSRGMGNVGNSHAEGIRFLVNNQSAATTVLTHMEGNHFNYGDQAFKNLELVYCPVGVYNSWADCTAVEAALQHLFNFLEVGSQRLWLRSGVGQDKRPLRGRDMRYIEKLKADGASDEMNLKFVCGITILKNVEVLSRSTDINGKNIVNSIKAGKLGTICRVHQPLKPTPCLKPAQEAALVATQLKLGPNFITRRRKRKAGVFDGQDTTHDDGED
jgi:hypothetical protein